MLVWRDIWLASSRPHLDATQADEDTRFATGGELPAHPKRASIVTRLSSIEAGSSSTDRFRDLENEVEGLLEKVIRPI